MWQRLSAFKNRGAAAAPAQPERDAYIEAAACALEACAAASASSGALTPRGSGREATLSLSSAGEFLGGDSFGQALRLILSAPVCQDRDDIVNSEAALASYFS